MSLIAPNQIDELKLSNEISAEEVFSSPKLRRRPASLPSTPGGRAISQLEFFMSPNPFKYKSNVETMRTSTGDYESPKLTSVSPGPSRYMNFKSPIASPYQKISSSPRAVNRVSRVFNRQGSINLGGLCAGSPLMLKGPINFASPSTLSKGMQKPRAESPCGKQESKIDCSNRHTSSINNAQSPRGMVFTTRPRRFLIPSPGSSSDGHQSSIQNASSNKGMTVHSTIQNLAAVPVRPSSKITADNFLLCGTENSSIDKEEDKKVEVKKLSVYDSYLQTIAKINKDASEQAYKGLADSEHEICVSTPDIQNDPEEIVSPRKRKLCDDDFVSDCSQEETEIQLIIDTSKATSSAEQPSLASVLTYCSWMNSELFFEPAELPLSSATKEEDEERGQEDDDQLSKSCANDNIIDKVDANTNIFSDDEDHRDNIDDDPDSESNEVDDDDNDEAGENIIKRRTKRKLFNPKVEDDPCNWSQDEDDNDDDDSWHEVWNDSDCRLCNDSEEDDLFLQLEDDSLSMDAVFIRSSDLGGGPMLGSEWPVNLKGYPSEMLSEDRAVASGSGSLKSSRIIQLQQDSSEDEGSDEDDDEKDEGKSTWHDSSDGQMELFEYSTVESVPEVGWSERNDNDNDDQASDVGVFSDPSVIFYSDRTSSELDLLNWDHETVYSQKGPNDPED